MAANPSMRAAVLKEHFARTDTSLRPILTSLNGDNAWLVSFPHPEAEVKATGMTYFHVVSDPWLVGPMVTIHSWVFQMNAPSPPAFPDATAVEHLAQEIEDAAADATRLRQGSNRKQESTPLIGAIFVSLHLTDHMHEPTLRSFDHRIPVFTTPEAAAVIQAWSHFDTVIIEQDLTPATAGSWQTLHPGAALPSWLSVFRIPGHHYLHFASVWVWSRDETHHEVMFLSPHGIHQDQPALAAFLDECRKDGSNTSVLAMLHGLKESFTFGGRNTLGVAGGLAVDRVAEPRYWVKSHDCIPTYQGIIGRFTRDFPRSLMDALGVDEGEDMAKKKASGNNVHDPNIVEVENGQCFVLE